MNGDEVVSDNIVAVGKHDADIFIKFFVDEFRKSAGLVRSIDWCVFFYAVCWAEKDSSFVRIDTIRRMEIGASLNVSDKTVKNSITRLIDAGLMKRLKRGMYEANSELVFNGNRLKK